MNNFTKFFFVVTMIMATNFCMANEFTTKSFHVKAVAIGKGQVYVHGYRAFGGSKEYGTLDKDGNYVPTEVLDWSGNIAEGQYRDHKYVFSPYGAYAYIACKEHGEGIYPVQLYAVPEEGHKLLGVYGPNAEGTGPDYTKPYVSYRNEVNGEGIIWDDWEGRIDTDNPVAVTEAGILPESEENPNPAKHFNANWNVSDAGIVEATGAEDQTHVNKRLDWSDLNTLFYVVFSDDPAEDEIVVTYEGVKTNYSLAEEPSIKYDTVGGAQNAVLYLKDSVEAVKTMNLKQQKNVAVAFNTTTVDTLYNNIVELYMNGAKVAKYLDTEVDSIVFEAEAEPAYLAFVGKQYWDDAFAVSREGEEIVLKYKTNTTPSFEGLPAWATVKGESTSNDTVSVTIAVASNTTSAVRNAVVRVFHADVEGDILYYITQDCTLPSGANVLFADNFDWMKAYYEDYANANSGRMFGDAVGKRDKDSNSPNFYSASGLDNLRAKFAELGYSDKQPSRKIMYPQDGYFKFGKTNYGTRLVLPTLNVTGTVNATITFNYAFHLLSSGAIDATELYVFVDGVKVNAEALPTTQVGGDATADPRVLRDITWQTATLNLTGISNTSVIEIGNESLTTTGRFYLDNIVIEAEPAKAIMTSQDFVSFMSAAAQGDYSEFLNDNGEVVLGADLDLTGVNYTEVSSFDGTFNFDGYKIKGLGNNLFKTLKGTVKNIKLEDINAPLFDTLSAGASIEDSLVFLTPLTYSLAMIVDTEIGNITLENDTLNAPLFARVTANGAVKNVELKSTVTYDFPVSPTNVDFGGIVGNNAGLVEKCKSAAQFDGKIDVLPGASFNFGGIVGASTGLVKDCEHTGTFKLYLPAPTKATYHTFGGVVGQVQAEADSVAITGCTNRGVVSLKIKTATYFMVGGVVGGTPSDKKCPGDYGVLENLTNRGNVSFTYVDGGSGSYPNIGGVVGYVEGKIRGCNNDGHLDQKCESSDSNWTCTRLGGVAGSVTLGADDCHNFGTFSVEGLYAGGTSGARNAANTELSAWAGCIACAGPYTPDGTVIFNNCTNDVNLTITPGSTTRTPHHCFGGVFGYLSACAQNCKNTGAIYITCNVATQNIGGIAGVADAPIKDCVNNGNLILDASDASYTSWMVRMGGIVGWSARTVDTTISDCSNRGNLSITGSNTGSSRDLFIGGIFGSCGNATLATGAALTNQICITYGCSNTGTLTFSNGLRGRIGNISGLYQE